MNSNSVQITMGNSYSTIKGLTLQQAAALRQVLSYSTNAQTAYFAGGNYPRRKYLIDAKGTFPTGLLHRVKVFLTANHLPCEILPPERHIRTKVEFKLQLKGITPRSGQKAAIEHARACNRGIIAMPTGTGKSLVIAMLIAERKVKTLVIVPNLSIKHQLIATIARLLGDMNNIQIENIDSAALKCTTDFDMLIIDECHHAAAKTYQRLNKVNWKGIYYRYFFTATPFRNDPEESLLFEGIAGEIIYQLSYKQAVADGSIVPVEAYYIEIPKQKTNADTWAEVYSELVVNNKERNMRIAHLMSTLEAVRIPALCLVKEIKHGNILSDMTSIDFANGREESSYLGEFNCGMINALIGTTGIVGEGVDTKPCEYVIIAGGGKAKSAFMQQVGRAVRTYPGKESAKVILIKDASHKFLSRHFTAQCAILKEEYGITPIKLDL